MSRTSPSGPKAITDEHSTAVQFDPNVLVVNTPYAWLLLPIPLIPLVAFTDPNALIFPFVQGSRTRPGRLGKTRFALIADPSTAGTSPVKVQWSVNGVPVGDELTIPWVTSVAPTTYAESCALVSGDEVDFGDVFWDTGDVLGLMITTGATFVGTTNTSLVMAYEEIFAP